MPPTDSQTTDTTASTEWQAAAAGHSPRDHYYLAGPLHSLMRQAASEQQLCALRTCALEQFKNSAIMFRATDPLERYREGRGKQVRTRLNHPEEPENASLRTYQTLSQTGGHQNAAGYVSTPSGAFFLLYFSPRSLPLSSLILSPFPASPAHNICSAHG